MHFYYFLKNFFFLFLDLMMYKQENLLSDLVIFQRALLVQ